MPTGAGYLSNATFEIAIIAGWREEGAGHFSIGALLKLTHRLRGVFAFAEGYIPTAGYLVFGFGRYG